MVTPVKTEGAWSGLDGTEEIIADLRDGKMVVILDDEDRENEGDLIMAATKVSPDDINFMARYGRGLICLTLTRARCEQLRLPLMVSDTDRRRATNFTVSIEAADGITTGISAHDRARTVRAAVAPDARPEDLSQPGHIFPVMAQPGGVLTRAGHTEAGCDLVRLAGLEPAAVIVEVLNDDGTMARRDDLIRFARHHDVKIGTIADLISYRDTNGVRAVSARVFRRSRQSNSPFSPRARGTRRADACACPRASPGYAQRRGRRSGLSFGMAFTRCDEVNSGGGSRSHYYPSPG